MIKDMFYKNINLILVCCLGLIYGGLLYPFYSEFIEFGQTLSGKVEYSSYNYFYISRDVAPSLLFVLSKFIVKSINNIYLANMIISSFISMIAFSSVFLLAEKIYPKSRFNLLIPIGLTSIFFPNYFLYPLWFPANFFVWGQIGFYLFISMITQSEKSIYTKLILVAVVTMCHPVYGTMGSCFYIFKAFYTKKVKIKNILSILICFFCAISFITSSHVSNYLSKDKIELSNNNNLASDNLKNKKKLDSTNNYSIVVKDKNTNLSNSHSPLFHGDKKIFLTALFSILLFPLFVYFLIKKINKQNEYLNCLNSYLLCILFLCLLTALSSYVIIDQIYLNKIFAVIDRGAPNRVLNCYFLLFIIIILNNIHETLYGLKNNFIDLYKYIFLFIFLLPVPIYISPYFWTKLYPSIIEFTLLLSIILYCLLNCFNFITKGNNITNYILTFLKNIYRITINNLKSTTLILFVLITLGALILRIYDFGIGPKYFVNNIEKSSSLESYLHNLPKKRGILVSYGVHGFRGMNVQQFSGMEYVLPMQSLPKYMYQNKIKSIGCYESSSIKNWGNIRDAIKLCFEKKSKLEWMAIFKKFNFSGLLVPSNYHLKMNMKKTDNVFTLYTVN